MDANPHTSQRLLTPREVSERLRVSLGTTYKMIRQGRVPAVRLGEAGTSLRVPEAELEAWLEADE